MSADATGPIDQPVRGEGIDLDQFLKLCGIASTGGHAKHLIQQGEIRVNGEIESRRRRQLKHGDVVQPIEGDAFRVQFVEMPGTTD